MVVEQMPGDRAVLGHHEGLIVYYHLALGIIATPQYQSLIKAPQ